MQMRTAGLSIALSTAILAMAPGAAAQQAQAPARIQGKPNLSGIWQALTEANWDIRPHQARPGPPQFGALFAEPAGVGIVEGNEIPYQPWAAAKQKENFAKRWELDPEAKCYMPGVPRATYMPFPFQIVQGTNKIVNPIVASVNQVTRSWNDGNGNYIPDCDLANRGANGECGALSNLNFGNPAPSTRYADDVLRGFGVRPYNWDVSAEVQHQVGAAMSVTGGYYRNWYGNFRVTDNQLVTPSDYKTYCVTGPADSRLPGGGNTQVCGLADINPDKFGQVNNVVRRAKDFGDQKQISNFFLLSVDARLPSGARFGGGVDTGTTLTDNCFVVDSPGQLVNCRVSQPMSANTQIKLNASYPLPADVFVSAIYQNLPGPNYTADWAAPVASITPSLGRLLSGNARTANVPLIEPQSEFEGRVTRLDVRLAKAIRIRDRVRVQANFDLYNVLNSGDILVTTSAYGARWLVPTLIPEPRILQFGAQVSF